VARSAVVVILALVWIGLFMVSFYAAMTMPPSGDGFTHGLNRATTVLAWQGGALFVALCALYAGLNAQTKPLAWISRIPLLIQIVLALLLVLFIAYRMAIA
jgi:hypothetical protein